MQHKAPRVVPGTDSSASLPVIAACIKLIYLKQLYRQGWLRRGVPPQQCESVAEHSFAVAILAWFLADALFADLDRDRVVRIALLHDVGEVYAGDLTPADQVAIEEKHRREADSVQCVLGELSEGDVYMDLWHEYEAGVTPEAKLVRQADRLEMAFQALAYEQQGLADLSEFYVTADQALAWPELRQVLDELQNLRAQPFGEEPR